MKPRVCIHCQATFLKGNALRTHVRKYHNVPKATIVRRKVTVFRREAILKVRHG